MESEPPMEGGGVYSSVQPHSAVDNDELGKKRESRQKEQDLLSENSPSNSIQVPSAAVREQETISTVSFNESFVIVANCLLSSSRAAQI